MVDLGRAAQARPAVVLSIQFQGNENAVVTYAPQLCSHVAGVLKNCAGSKLIRRLIRLSDHKFAEAAVRRWLGSNQD
jgi:hypothetical protein